MKKAVFFLSTAFLIFAACFSAAEASEERVTEANALYEKATEYFGEAAFLSVSDADAGAMAYFKGTCLLEAAAELGDERAMLCLGLMYEDAPGIASKTASLRWYSRYLRKKDDPAIAERVEFLKKASAELTKIIIETKSGS